MVQGPVVIKLTDAQREMIRQTSGKDVTELGVEPMESGAGWLFEAGESEFWLLKHPDPESYSVARQERQPRIDPRYTRFRLEIRASSIHRWGVFALERIPARRNVIEYKGELVNPVEIYRRMKDQEETYALKLNDFWRIDGSVGGSGAEIINHSCDPNLQWRKRAGRVQCQSLRRIRAGEELTVDYSFSIKAPKVPCLCGSPKCRGTINAAK
jgi:uncharacterized protein